MQGKIACNQIKAAGCKGKVLLIDNNCWTQDIPRQRRNTLRCDDEHVPVLSEMIHEDMAARTNIKNTGKRSFDILDTLNQMGRTFLKQDIMCHKMGGGTTPLTAQLGAVKNKGGVFSSHAFIMTYAFPGFTVFAVNQSRRCDTVLLPPL